MVEEDNKEVDYDKLIYSWYQRANFEDYFSKFVFMYLAFAAFLKKKKFPHCARDRDAIEELKKDKKIKEKFYNFYVNINRQLYVRIEGLVRELKERPLRNETDGQTRQVVIQSVEDWENIIEFIYTVRNNLFHGEKSPEDARDYFMVQYAYELISPIVSVCIRELDLKRIWKNE